MMHGMGGMPMGQGGTEPQEPQIQSPEQILARARAETLRRRMQGHGGHGGAHAGHGFPGGPRVPSPMGGQHGGMGGMGM